MTATVGVRAQERERDRGISNRKILRIINGDRRETPTHKKSSTVRPIDMHMNMN